jgi:hypothetical protein
MKGWNKNAMKPFCTTQFSIMEKKGSRIMQVDPYWPELLLVEANEEKHP